MNKFLIFILFFLYSSFHFAYIANSKEFNGEARIIDGDSIEINDHMIRLIGIDAFEIKQECFKKNNAKYKCGEQSALILATIISGQPIHCTAEKKDRYKRWLAACYIGKLDINENMVLYGYAFSYMSNKYKNSEKEAKKVKAGAWSGKIYLSMGVEKSNKMGK